MDRIEDHGGSGQPGQRTARDRQCDQRQHAGTTVRQQQQHRETERTDQAEPLGFGARTRADDRAEIAGPADFQARAAGIGQAHKRVAQRVDRCALRARVEAGRARLHEQQRLAVRREPDSVAQRRCVLGRPTLRQRKCLQGRIARQQRLEQFGARRSKILQPLLELRAQEIGIEVRVVERRRQQVTVRQPQRIERRQVGIAVQHFAEARVATKCRGEFLAQGDGRFGHGRGNRQQQQARGRAFADLVEQQALVGGLRRRHEAAQVVADDQRAAHGEREHGQRGQPADDEAAPSRAAHGVRRWHNFSSTLRVGESGSDAAASRPSSMMLASPSG